MVWIVYILGRFAHEATLVEPTITFLMVSMRFLYGISAIRALMYVTRLLQVAVIVAICEKSLKRCIDETLKMAICIRRFAHGATIIL